ncbi:hydrogenase [Desulfoferula mesophila]|uniref:Hydrogenase n=1 Tax=Desulfoferula mesophila TaxID=3058419 RepID=A0AAU9EIT9_9BACT|nr:hydrogenase [Desulfoferula mesophilus]
MKSNVWDASVKYELLLNVTNAIITQTNRDDLFSALANELKKVVAYDRLSVYIFDPKEQALSYFATANGVVPQGMENPAGRPLDKASVAQRTINIRKPLIIKDLATVTNFSTVPAMLRAGLRATMAFPLIVRNDVLGTMHLSFKKPPDDFESLSEMLADLSHQVAIAVDNMLAHTRLRNLSDNLEKQKRYLQKQAHRDYLQEKFVFSSKQMGQVIHEINLVAKSDAPVLITGETGTGKDYLAHYIHDSSLRRDSLLVKINCPALASSLFESELFGHSRGAFTGAHDNRMGRFEMAEGGTIFLDEIGDLPLGLQAKLLHVLQDHAFERVGDSRTIQADFRVIAATNHDLDSAMESGAFRHDLFYRLATVTLQIPPLRERTEDIPLLIERFISEEETNSNMAAPSFDASAIDMLCGYGWPGNVRELKNFIRRIFLLKSGKRITEREVAQYIGDSRQPCGEDVGSLTEMERKIIEKALQECGGFVGGKRGAAHRLNLPTSTLQYRIKKLGINPKHFAR